MANAEITTKTRKEMREVEITEELISLTMSKREALVLFGILACTSGRQSLSIYGALRKAFGDKWTSGFPISDLVRKQVSEVNLRPIQSQINELPEEWLFDK